MQHCDCGFKGYVQLRSGSLPTQGPAMPPVIVPAPITIEVKETLWPRLKQLRGRPAKKK